MGAALIRHVPSATVVLIACALCKRLLSRNSGRVSPVAPSVPALPSAATPAPAAQDLFKVPLETLIEAPTDAEAPGKEFKEIAACDLPCSAEEFFSSVLATRSPALHDVHGGAGHFDVVKGVWEKLPDSHGLTRAMTFVTPVSAPMGPKQTRVVQRHTAHLHPGGVLMYRSTQQNLDIPFKDSFSVQLLWRVAPNPASGGSRLSIHLAVPFSSWCAFKGIIQSTTTRETTAFCESLLQHVQKVVPASPTPAPAGAAAALAAVAGKGALVPGAGAGSSEEGGVLARSWAGRVVVVVGVLCCALQLWVLSQAWAVVVACEAQAGVREWQPVAGAGAAVVSLLVCLMQLR